jgi:hypothetical protein
MRNRIGALCTRSTVYKAGMRFALRVIAGRAVRYVGKHAQLASLMFS